MRARFYHPILRRFLNQDVLLGTISPGIALNRYAFANGNPVSLMDPFGLYAGVDDAIAIGLGAAVGVASQGVSDVIFASRQ